MKNNKFKIGIITYHEPISYGAHLQCFGLQKYLKDTGYDAEIIDYSSKGYLELRRTKKIKSLIKRGCNVLKSPISFIKARNNANKIQIEQEKYKTLIIKRNKKFKDFEAEYYNLSKERYENYSDLKNLIPKYDAYICGSDQIWNPGFCDMDDNYFLSFAPENKRVAYAPSFGVSKIPFYAIKEYKKRLKSIKYISVREKTGAKIIKKLTNRNVPVVIDPTFLIGKEEWSKIADRSDIELPEEYIVTYFIGIDDYIKKYINEVKIKYSGYKIINLVFDQTEFGPCDFLKLISKAKFVFTNSFHGLAFAINFNVPFAVGKTLKDFGKNSAFARMEDLLDNFELSNRIYFGDQELDNSWLDLDYLNVNRIKKELVNNSKKYLNKSLEDIKE